MLLDIKYTSDELYLKHVGCSMDRPLRFLEALNSRKIPVTLRQVIIPTLNDTQDNLLALLETAEKHACVDRVELLPFRKICQTKYDAMKLTFPFGHLPEPDRTVMEGFRKLLGKYGG